MRYSTIHHDLRKRFELTISEYLVCDSIYQCSHNAPTKKTNVELGEFLGIDNSHVGSVKKKLLSKGLITDDQNGTQTTELWNDSVAGETGKIPTKVGKSQKNWENPNHSLYNKVNKVIPEKTFPLGKEKEKSVWREDVPQKSKRERIVPTTPSSVVDKWNSYPTWKALKRPGSPPNPSAVDKLLPTAKSTPDIQAAIIRKRTKYTEAEFNLAIENYVLDILNRKQDKSTYYAHRFTLYEFLVNKDVFEKYVNR